jgi:transposase
MDGVHPTHNTQLAYGCIRKGFRKEICANSGRSRLNLSGAIDLISKKLHIQEDVTLNGDSTISFLKKIEAAYPNKNKIHLFSDNARYYKNKAVKKHLEHSKIILHFLPPYSPNLNPIERLWKWMKERVMYNTYYEYFEDFKLAIIGFLESVSSLDPACVLGQAFASRVRDKFRPIGAPLSTS